MGLKNISKFSEKSKDSKMKYANHYKPTLIKCHYYQYEPSYSILWADNNHIIFPYIEFYQLLLKDYLIYSQYQLYPMSTLYKYELQFKRF